MFKRSILFFLFVVDYRIVLKHFLNLNIDESILRILIKNESILHFNHRYGFWASSLLSQLELFKVLVFGKVCVNLIKLSLFCFIYFSFLLLFFISFWFFVSFAFTGVRTIPRNEDCLPIRVRFRVSFRVRARVGGAIVLEPFLPVEEKEIFYMPRKC